VIPIAMPIQIPVLEPLGFEMVIVGDGVVEAVGHVIDGMEVGDEVVMGMRVELGIMMKAVLFIVVVMPLSGVAELRGMVVGGRTAKMEPEIEVTLPGMGSGTVDGLRALGGSWGAACDGSVGIGSALLGPFGDGAVEDDSVLCGTDGTPEFSVGVGEGGGGEVDDGVGVGVGIAEVGELGMVGAGEEGVGELRGGCDIGVLGETATDEELSATCVTREGA